MNLVTNQSTCCLYSNFVVPSGGPWGAIVLNYTGQAVGGVFDSSYRAYVDGAQVLFGTTPEYGRWIVLKDLTEYSSFFVGTVNVTFLLSAATTGGYFLSTVSVLFYPPATGTPPPSEPNLVIPIWNKTYVRASAPMLSRNISVPTNVTNATLELYVYGFGPDEFWYLQMPGFRNAVIAVDNQPIVSVLPYPALNTGGLDLFLWRPLPAAYTLNNRPYHFDVTGALGLIEGAHNFTAKVPGLLASSDWLVGGNLLLYTRSGVSGATQSSYGYSSPAPTILTDRTTFYNENGTVAFHYASTITTSSGSVAAATFVNETYRAANTLTPNWQNLTALETMRLSTVTQSGNDQTLGSLNYAFPFGVDLGSYFTETSSNNGSYPIYGNFTSYAFNLHQEWNESGQTLALLAGAPVASTSFSVKNTAVATSGVTAGREELISPTAALLLSISFISAATTDLFTSSGSGSGGSASYSHLIVGSSYQPPGPYNVETVTVNDVLAPLNAAASVSASRLDIGQTTTFTAVASGGEPPFSYLWTGLPAGCRATNAPLISCAPSAAGSFSVVVGITDATNLTAFASPVSLVVAPPVTATIMAATSALDEGGSTNVTAAIGGGTAPYRCIWFVGGIQQTGTGDCSAPLNVVAPLVSGTLLIELNVTDALGSSKVSTTNLPVSSAPQVVLSAYPATATVTIGTVVECNATVAGGTGPFQYAWFLDGVLVAGFNGTSYPFVSDTVGNFSVVVEVTDASGTVTTASPVSILVAQPAPAPAGSPFSPISYALLGVGIVAGFGVGVGLMRMRGRPKRAPPNSQASLPRAPARPKGPPSPPP